MIEIIFYIGIVIALALMLIWAGLTILDKVREKDEMLIILCMMILVLVGVVFGVTIGINLAM